MQKVIHSIKKYVIRLFKRKKNKKKGIKKERKIEKNKGERERELKRE
jgi:hypothetical protein